VVVQSPAHAVRALQHLETFCTKVDLQLDRRKTYVWSLSASGRKWFRSQGLTVGHGGRNLGAHMQLTLKHTNASLQERADSLKDLWDRLRLSVSPYKIKVRALTVAAWPKGLHGVAATLLGGLLPPTQIRCHAWPPGRWGWLQPMGPSWTGGEPVV
jgi:hypothetical protein